MSREEWSNGLQLIEEPIERSQATKKYLQDTDGTSGFALWATNTFNNNVSVGDIITIIGINVNGIVRIYKDIVVFTATNTINLKNLVIRSSGTYYIAKKSTRTKSPKWQCETSRHAPYFSFERPWYLNPST